MKNILLKKLVHYNFREWNKISQYPKKKHVSINKAITLMIYTTIDLINLPCPKFDDLAFIRIFRICIYRS